MPAMITHANVCSSDFQGFTQELVAVLGGIVLVAQERQGRMHGSVSLAVFLAKQLCVRRIGSNTYFDEKIIKHHEYRQASMMHRQSNNIPFRPYVINSCKPPASTPTSARRFKTPRALSFPDSSASEGVHVAAVPRRFSGSLPCFYE
jgi:hypothetical protein